jgi:hypothetical protein
MRNVILFLSLFFFTVAQSQTCMFYTDADMDGYGDDLSFTESPCDIVPPGTTLTPGDCDDFDPMINPAAVEICNYLDDNCNGGEVDEFVQLSFYMDADFDGYGDANVLVLDCFEQPGFVTNMEDCDDNLVTYQDLDADGWGSAIADPCGVDNNLDCNDMTSSIQEASMYFEDQDGDGYGNPDMGVYLCESQTGYIPDGTDCDDLNPNAYPNAEDITGNGIDENCDGQDGVGISEDVMESLELWPNPVKDVLNIELPVSGSMTITNLQGQWIMEQPLFAGINPVQLEVEPGYYWAIIKSTQGQVAKKIYKL